MPEVGGALIDSWKNAVYIGADGKIVILGDYCNDAVQFFQGDPNDFQISSDQQTLIFENEVYNYFESTPLI